MYNDMSTIIKVIVYLVIIASHEAKRIHTYVCTYTHTKLPNEILSCRHQNGLEYVNFKRRFGNYCKTKK